LAVWAFLIPAVHAALMWGFGRMYQDNPAGLAALGLMAKMPTTVIFGGPAYGADNYTLAAMFGNEMTLYYAVPLALGAAMLVVRQTREDEERGAYELIGAAPVGRFAATTASLITTAATMLVAGTAHGVVSVAGGFDPASSLAYGLGLALCAITFGALACLLAQLASSAKSAVMAVVIAIGAAFIVRGLGDLWGATSSPPTNGSPLSFMSPLAWVQQARPFVDLRIWPLLLYLPLIALLVVVAFAVQSKRDYGRGVLAVGLGRANASASLTGVLALNLRLIRANWLNWAGFAAVFSAACGPIMSDVPDYMKDNPELGALLGLPPDAAGDLIVQTFVAMIVWFAALFGVSFALGAVSRFRSDETSGLMELQLAYPVSRTRLLATQAGVGLAGAMAITVIGTASLGATLSSEFRDGQSALGYATQLAAKSLAFTPGLALSVALAALLIGAAPRAGWLNWVLLSWGVVGGMFGAALGVPRWVVELSPIAATPQVPMVSITAAPLLVMSALALVASVTGALTLQRRDISTV
jgi:ABC-2 type transport system permease protein